MKMPDLFISSFLLLYKVMFTQGAVWSSYHANTMYLKFLFKDVQKGKTRNILLPMRLHFLVQERLMYKTSTRQIYHFLNKNLFTFNLYFVCMMCVYQYVHAVAERGSSPSTFTWVSGMEADRQSLARVSFLTEPSQRATQSLASLTYRKGITHFLTVQKYIIFKLSYKVTNKSNSKKKFRNLNLNLGLFQKYQFIRYVFGT